MVDSFHASRVRIVDAFLPGSCLDVLLFRYLLVHLKADGTRPGGCYLVDRAFAAFRVQLWPAPAEWGDMLLDGTLVVVGGSAVFVVFDCLYFDGTRTIPEVCGTDIASMYFCYVDIRPGFLSQRPQ